VNFEVKSSWGKMEGESAQEKGGSAQAPDRRKNRNGIGLNHDKRKGECPGQYLGATTSYVRKKVPQPTNTKPHTN